MVQRFNDQILQNMSPERRARNLSVMKALTQASMKIKNKENEDPLNNNKAPPFICKHSTPLKNQRIADLDSMVPISQAEITASDDAIIPLDSYLGVTKNKEASSEPELVIAKVYDLTSKANGIIPQQAKEKQKVENKSSVIKVVVTKEGEVEKLKSLKKYDADSTPNEALDTIAEIEFFKGLEQSKLVNSVYASSFKRASFEIPNNKPEFLRQALKSICTENFLNEFFS